MHVGPCFCMNAEEKKRPEHKHTFRSWIFILETWPFQIDTAQGNHIDQICFEVLKWIMIYLQIKCVVNTRSECGWLTKLVSHTHASGSTISIPFLFAFDIFVIVTALWSFCAWMTSFWKRFNWHAFLCVFLHLQYVFVATISEKWGPISVMGELLGLMSQLKYGVSNRAYFSRWSLQASSPIRSLCYDFVLCLLRSDIIEAFHFLFNPIVVPWPTRILAAS